MPVLLAGAFIKRLANLLSSHALTYRFESFTMRPGYLNHQHLSHIIHIRFSPNASL